MPLINPANKDIAIIHDDRSGEVIAKAAIINYDKAHQIITVSADFFDPNECPRVSMLILGQDSIIECQGVVRKYVEQGLREIAVFNAKEKEGRSYVRYGVHMQATILNQLRDGKAIPLEEPLDVAVENISSSGVLICTSSNLFNTNSAFQLKINIAGNDVIINTIVVRTSPSSDGCNELGCEFVALS